jgi:hypothetical protein
VIGALVIVAGAASVIWEYGWAGAGAVLALAMVMLAAAR